MYQPIHQINNNLDNQNFDNNHDLDNDFNNNLNRYSNDNHNLSRQEIIENNTLEYKVASKRLMKDYKNWMKNQNIEVRKKLGKDIYFNVEPLENNLYEWHGNLSPKEGYYQGYIVHFVMKFDDNYPSNPPNISLKNGILHSNIIPEHNGERFFLCMDLINNFFWLDSGSDDSIPYSGWSVGYSVEIIVQQLYSFLFDKEVENYDGKIKHTLYELPPELGGGYRDIKMLRKELIHYYRECVDFSCSCGHCYNSPSPYVTKFDRNEDNIIIKRNILDYSHLDNSIEITEIDDIDDLKNIMDNYLNYDYLSLKDIFFNKTLLNKNNRVIFSYLILRIFKNIGKHKNIDYDNKSIVPHIQNTNKVIKQILHISNYVIHEYDSNNIFYNNNSFVNLYLLKSLKINSNINLLKKYLKRFFYCVKTISRTNKYFMKYMTSDKDATKKVNTPVINYDFDYKCDHKSGSYGNTTQNNNNNNNNNNNIDTKYFYNNKEYVCTYNVSSDSYPFIIEKETSTSFKKECDIYLEEFDGHYCVNKNIDFIGEPVMKKVFLKNKNYIDNKLSFDKLLENKLDNKTEIVNKNSDDNVNGKQDIDNKIDKLLDDILSYAIKNQSKLNDTEYQSESNYGQNIIMKLLELLFDKDDIYNFIISINSHSTAVCKACSHCKIINICNFKQLIMNLSVFHQLLCKDEKDTTNWFNNEFKYSNLIKIYSSIKETIDFSNKDENICSTFLSFLIEFNSGLVGTEQIYKDLNEINIDEDLVYRNNDSNSGLDKSLNNNLISDLDSDSNTILSYSSIINTKKISVDNIPIEIWQQIMDHLSDTDRYKLLGISNYLDSIINSSYFNEKKWLKCFYLQCNYKNELLGYPLEVSIFAQSNTLKSIESSLDIISFKAYNDLDIKKTIWNKSFKFWIPLYINKSHFQKSLPIFMKELLKIYYNLDNDSTYELVIDNLINKNNTNNVKNVENEQSNMMSIDGKHVNKKIIINCIIDIYCYLMTTLSVNMMKEESYISIKNTEGFFQIYNLFYQLTKQFPGIIDEIDLRIERFIKRAQYRHKRFTPNLGNLISMMLLSKKYKWKNISKFYLEEAQDRRVLRYFEIFLENPNITNASDFLKPVSEFKLLDNNNFLKDFQLTDEDNFDNDQLLIDYMMNYKNHLVGQKLLIFNLHLLENVIKYDKDRTQYMSKIIENYGYPLKGTKLQLQEKIKQIQKINNIESCYHALNIYMPKKEILAQNIYQSYIRSNRKGYNKSLNIFKVDNESMLKKCMDMDWRRK